MQQMAVDKIENINRKIIQIAQQGQSEMAEALQKLGQALVDETKLDKADKDDLIDNLKALSKAANAAASGPTAR